MVLTTVLLAAAQAAGAAGWSVEPTPSPAGSSLLYGVSCASAGACTAVGVYVDSAGSGVTLAERRNGTGWTIQPTPNPIGATYSTLTGVSCPSPTSCTAVGNYRNSAGIEVTLAESWDGAKWTIEPTPNPSGAIQSTLSGVSCASASACTAVGDYHNSMGADRTLAEIHGAGWAIERTATPRGAQSASLQSVSCRSATACTAVGSYTNSAHLNVSLAERSNVTSWTIQPSLNPRGAIGTSLQSVSCPTASACTAVGDYINSARIGLTLAERWNGTKWTIQPTPNPTGAFVSALLSASCATASACTAVGINDNNQVLGERWSGASWAIQPIPEPIGALDGELYGVSCASATVCSAVGRYRNGSGTFLTLAERSS